MTAAGCGWSRRGPCRLARRALQDGLLVPAVRAFGAPFRAHGGGALLGLEEPVVIVANHASHLDAPAILAALPASVRRRTAVAAAADYFYRDRVLGFAVTLGIGAFPFPRHGTDGLDEAARLLAGGDNVLLFPEGTRSADGGQHVFRDGVGHLLLATGAPVAPAAIRGSHALWPRGRRLPRRGPLEVRFGGAWRPGPGLSARAISSELARRVAALANAS
jgi:1-acyl-sn-glycerol-3-phosphate acyltransferase